VWPVAKHTYPARLTGSLVEGELLREFGFPAALSWLGVATEPVRAGGTLVIEFGDMLEMHVYVEGEQVRPIRGRDGWDVIWVGDEQRLQLRHRYAGLAFFNDLDALEGRNVKEKPDKTLVHIDFDHSRHRWHLHWGLGTSSLPSLLKVFQWTLSAHPLIFGLLTEEEVLAQFADLLRRREQILARAANAAQHRMFTVRLDWLAEVVHSGQLPPALAEALARAQEEAAQHPIRDPSLAEAYPPPAAFADWPTGQSPPTVSLAMEYWLATGAQLAALVAANRPVLLHAAYGAGRWLVSLRIEDAADVDAEPWTPVEPDPISLDDVRAAVRALATGSEHPDGPSDAPIAATPRDGPQAQPESEPTTGDSSVDSAERANKRASWISRLLRAMVRLVAKLFGYGAAVVGMVGIGMLATANRPVDAAPSPNGTTALGAGQDVHESSSWTELIPVFGPAALVVAVVAVVVAVRSFAWWRGRGRSPPPAGVRARVGAIASVRTAFSMVTEAVRVAARGERGPDVLWRLNGARADVVRLFARLGLVDDAVREFREIDDLEALRRAADDLLTAWTARGGDGFALLDVMPTPGHRVAVMAELARRLAQSPDEGDQRRALTLVSDLAASPYFRDVVAIGFLRGQIAAGSSGDALEVVYGPEKGRVLFLRIVALVLQGELDRALTAASQIGSPGGEAALRVLGEAERVVALVKVVAALATPARKVLKAPHSLDAAEVELVTGSASPGLRYLDAGRFGSGSAKAAGGGPLGWLSEDEVDGVNQRVPAAVWDNAVPASAALGVSAHGPPIRLLDDGALDEAGVEDLEDKLIAWAFPGRHRVFMYRRVYHTILVLIAAGRLPADYLERVLAYEQHRRVEQQREPESGGTFDDLADQLKRQYTVAAASLGDDELRGAVLAREIVEVIGLPHRDRADASELARRLGVATDEVISIVLESPLLLWTPDNEVVVPSPAALATGFVAGVYRGQPSIVLPGEAPSGTELMINGRFTGPYRRVDENGIVVVDLSALGHMTTASENQAAEWLRGELYVVLAKAWRTDPVVVVRNGDTIVRRIDLGEPMGVAPGTPGTSTSVVELVTQQHGHGRELLLAWHPVAADSAPGPMADGEHASPAAVRVTTPHGAGGGAVVRRGRGGRPDLVLSVFHLVKGMRAESIKVDNRPVLGWMALSPSTYQNGKIPDLVLLVVEGLDGVDEVMLGDPADVGDHVMITGCHKGA
jgi:hypothetical protein